MKMLHISGILAYTSEFMEVLVMDFIINMLADITDIFVDIWANKIVDRFARKKRKNEVSDNLG